MLEMCSNHRRAAVWKEPEFKHFNEYCITTLKLPENRREQPRGDICVAPLELIEDFCYSRKGVVFYSDIFSLCLCGEKHA